MSVDIIPIPALKDNYIWTIVNRDKKLAACIDPGEARPVLEYLELHDLQLDAILITHHHWDHTNGVNKLLQKYTVPVYGPAKEPIPAMTAALTEGDHVNLKAFDMQLEVIDIPGHTLGHIAYYGHGYLFAGDTLFAAGCGRIFEGTAKQMYASLQKLAALPAETQLYCGHEYTEANLRFAKIIEPDNHAILERIDEVQEIRRRGQASLPCSLATELQTNPFLRCEEAAVQAAAMQHRGRKVTQASDVFATIRDWKNHI